MSRLIRRLFNRSADMSDLARRATGRVNRPVRRVVDLKARLLLSALEDRTVPAIIQ